MSASPILSTTLYFKKLWRSNVQNRIHHEATNKIFSQAFAVILTKFRKVKKIQFNVHTAVVHRKIVINLETKIGQITRIHRLLSMTIQKLFFFTMNLQKLLNSNILYNDLMYKTTHKMNNLTIIQIKKIVKLVQPV
jgi:hypothetical protein